MAHLVDTLESGIFEWDDGTMKHIQNCNVMETQADKQLMMVSYLFELIYDLMIRPTDNVSLNGCLELCHGIFQED